MNYLSFKDIVDKYKLKNQATSNIKIKEVLKQFKIPANVYMRDDQFTTNSGIVNLHPTKGTHWVLFHTGGALHTRGASHDKFYFDSYGCPPPVNVINQIGKGTYSEYKIQKDDSYCASYCLYVLYLTQVIGFKNAVLSLYYQTFQQNFHS